MDSVIDQDIAHIACVMPQALRAGSSGSPILPAPYWRTRLHWLLGESHLTKQQLRAIDDRLFQLDRFDMQHPVEPDHRGGRSRSDESRRRSATILPLRRGNSGSAAGAVKTQSLSEGKNTTGPAVITGIVRRAESAKQQSVNITESMEPGQRPTRGADEGRSGVADLCEEA